jgi:hypothetical protein
MATNSPQRQTFLQFVTKSEDSIDRLKNIPKYFKMMREARGCGEVGAAAGEKRMGKGRPRAALF